MEDAKTDRKTLFMELEDRTQKVHEASCELAKYAEEMGVSVLGLTPKPVRPVEDCSPSVRDTLCLRLDAMEENIQTTYEILQEF